MRKKHGFTLIELLVVIAIIALLVSILLPSLNRAKEMAKRATCMANINGIGKSGQLYATEYSGMMPLSGGAIYEGSGAYTNWYQAVGTYRTSEPPKNNEDNSVTASQWLLIRGNYTTAKAFICKSTDNQTDDYTSGGTQYSVDELWDFEAYNNFSYSFQPPYQNPMVTLSSPGGLAIIADKSPMYDSLNGSRDSAITPAEDDETNNSPNHGKDGQNVGFIDGHCEWSVKANAGINEDHIYTRVATPGTTDPKVGQAPSAGYVPKIEDDSFLVH